ncbi:MAG: NAD(P)-binding protein [Isosphaeraceae bacterium]
MSDVYDYVIVGSGMAGLTVGSLPARAGNSVCLLVAHEHPGGCAHSFPIGRYTFCAAAHYIPFCGEGEPVHNFLKKIGLHELGYVHAA